MCGEGECGEGIAVAKEHQTAPWWAPSTLLLSGSKVRTKVRSN